MNDNTFTILIVEADPVERDLIRLVLTRNGFMTEWVDNGEEALESVRKKRPDLILLDLFLPQQSGLGLLSQLMQSKPENVAPVIAISSLGFPEIVKQAIQAGARDFLVKPIETSQLVERVKKLLS
jgi:two-component system phosphate regulon response regulator PhoB